MSGVFVTSTHHILHITQGLLHQGESQCFNKEQCEAQLEYTQGYCHLYRPRFQHYRSTFLLLIDSTAEHCHSDRSSELVYVFHHANFQRYESFFDKPITLVSTLPVIGVQYSISSIVLNFIFSFWILLRHALGSNIYWKIKEIEHPKPFKIQKIKSCFSKKNP